MNLKDTLFLKTLDNQRNKVFYTKISVLDKFDKVIDSIEGRVQDGSSISINGTSNVRRTCNLTLVADKKENNLTDIENLLSVNKKIKIMIGIEKSIDYSKDIYFYMNKNDTRYDINNPYAYGFPPIGEKGNIYVDRKTTTYWIWNGKAYQKINSIYEYQSETVWFPLGVFVITQPSISNGVNGCTISLSCKDKMCLLNGEMGGILPSSVTFDKYDQKIQKIECTKDPRTDKDLKPNIYTVYHYLDNIKDYYFMWNNKTGWDNGAVSNNQKFEDGEVISVKQLIYDIIYTAVVNYGGELTNKVIINDIPFQIKQSLRYTGSGKLYYNPQTHTYTQEAPPAIKQDEWLEFDYNEDVGYALDTDFIYPEDLIGNVGENVCSVLDKIKNILGNFEYFYDIEGNFIFQEIKNYLNNAYDKEKEKNNVVTFYLGNEKISDNFLQIIGAENYKVEFYNSNKSIYTFNENTGLITSYSNTPNYSNLKNDYHIWGKNSSGKDIIHYHLVLKNRPTCNEWKVVFLKDKDKYNGKIRLAENNDEDPVFNYIPTDWRAELYLRGLEAARAGGRPDKYQQELLDLFDGIYEFGYYDNDNNWHPTGRFKNAEVDYPSQLKYFIDFLEPVDNLYGLSVDEIESKIYSCQKDNVNRLYSKDIPDCIIISSSLDEKSKIELIEKCETQGQAYSIVDSDLYSNLKDTTVGYSAEEIARELLYQYTSYIESITLTCIPIYYLETNRRITVKDKKSGINGDYIINSITMPLNAGSTMSITASRALDRI